MFSFYHFIDLRMKDWYDQSFDSIFLNKSFYQLFVFWVVIDHQTLETFMSVTNISFVLRSEGGSTLTRAIESLRHRELASSRSRVVSKSDEIFAKWWKSFEMMTAYFVMNKALHAAYSKHFESSAFWDLNIFYIFHSFFLFFSFFSVCRLSMIRHLLNLFIELIVT